MEDLYHYCSISRQGYFQARLRYEQELQMMEAILKIVRSYRVRKDARAGSRSLHQNLNIKSQFGLGINKFEQLMSAYRGSLMPLRTRIITTKSCPRSKRYLNLANGLVISNINELVVGDLTYLVIGKSRYYLFCLTDVYSCRIVGYCLSQRMRATEAYEALRQWWRLRGEDALVECCHHTDGGSQYFSNLYLRQMEKMKLCISVVRNCLENGYAEQRNGLIKHHLLPTLKGFSTSNLQKEFEKLIYFYNHERKQEGLDWRSPVAHEAYIKTLADRPKKKLYTFEKYE